MEQIWEIIAPYIAAIGGVGGAGTIIYIILRLLLDKILKKNNKLVDSTYNAESLSQKVAERLAGKTLNIDVTAVTERALKKLNKELDGKIREIVEMTNSLKGMLVPMAKGIIKLKALTKEEVSELSSAIKALEHQYTPPEESEVMTVVLQPLNLELEEQMKQQPPAGGLNFNGLGD